MVVYRSMVIGKEPGFRVRRDGSIEKIIMKLQISIDFPLKKTSIWYYQTVNEEKNAKLLFLNTLQCNHL